MQIESVHIKKFRNLLDFKIDFTKPKTVLIGQNASGKSNFIEALALFFKQLDFPNKISKELWFDCGITYTIYDKKIKINRFRDESGKEHYEYKQFKELNVSGEEVFEDIKKFKENKDKYLPKYIFAYYSGLGNSNRLEEHFNDYKAQFARQAMDSNPTLKYPRGVYAELVHGQFSLFAFFIESNEEKKKELKKFLLDNLSIEDIQSVLLSIEEPYWNKSPKNGKDKFFGSRGLVSDLLNHIYDEVAFAPFRDTKKKEGVWTGKKNKNPEVVYLYISNFDKIIDFVQKKGWTNFEFFHILNTTTLSKLLSVEGIRICVKKKYADNILFKNLSEGEQQLLTVLGLMLFTYTEEALFLLDEPDTHLNPLWQWKYMEFIDQIVLKNKQNPSIQVIMSSHAPLTIGGLKKEEVRRLIQDEDKIKAVEPLEDPKGMGVAGILTEIFGIPSTLDIKTNQQLERRRHIQSMFFNLENYNHSIPENENTENLKLELSGLDNELSDLGFSNVIRDPLYQKFQAKFDKEMNYRKSLLRPLTIEEEQYKEKLMEQILKELLDEEGL